VNYGRERNGARSPRRSGDLRSNEVRGRETGAQRNWTSRPRSPSAATGGWATLKHAFCETKPFVMLKKSHLYGTRRMGCVDYRKMTNGSVFSVGRKGRTGGTWRAYFAKASAIAKGHADGSKTGRRAAATREANARDENDLRLPRKLHRGVSSNLAPPLPSRFGLSFAW